MSKIKIMSYDDIIISETDLKGTIISVNDKFLEMVRSDYNNVIGRPHSIIRHPKMPSKVFEEMWYSIKNGNLWSGIVLNICLDNEYTYWMYTEITPQLDENNNIVSYKSIRRQATASEIVDAMKLYNF